jgi:hypothetical protein
VNGSGALGSGGGAIAYSIAIAPVAFTGARTVAITNGTSDYSFPFTVAPSAAALTSVLPSGGCRGGSYALQVVGTGTHWVQGVTTASLASGIAINCFNNSPFSNSCHPRARASVTMWRSIRKRTSVRGVPLSKRTSMTNGARRFRCTNDKVRNGFNLLTRHSEFLDQFVDTHVLKVLEHRRNRHPLAGDALHSRALRPIER